MPIKKTIRAELFQAKNKEWSYRIIAGNGRITLTPGETYKLRGGARRALRSLQELADEFGQPLQVLASIMSKDPAAPKPELDHSTHVARARYFNAAAVRAWWKARNP